MYLYSFSHFAGQDRVFEVITPMASKISSGDLIRSGGSLFLVLGKKVAREEQYEQTRNNPDRQMVRASFVKKKTLYMIHWMVYQWYTTYKKVIPLYITADLEKTLTRYTKTKKKNLTVEMFVFADVWTMKNWVPLDTSSSDSVRGTTEMVQLTSTDSAIKHQKIRATISQENIQKISVLGSQIFWDWGEIQKITIIDSHKRYFASHSDPRYKVGTILTEMGRLYECEVEEG